MFFKRVRIYSLYHQFCLRCLVQEGDVAEAAVSSREKTLCRMTDLLEIGQYCSRDWVAQSYCNDRPNRG